MKSDADQPATAPARLEPLLLGTALAVISSLAYSCANVCLRNLARHDPLLVSCMKAVPTLLIASGLMLFAAARGNLRWPSRRAVAVMLGVGTVSQLGGNAMFQWALGQVGLALTVPLCSGAMIIGAALLGWMWLGEGVSQRSAIAIGLLVAAICVLSYGAERAPQKAEVDTATVPVTVALAASCFSGIIYAVLSVTLRRLATGSTQLPVMLATISSAGVVSLGLGSLIHIGPEAMSQTPLNQLGLMLLAGVFNAGGFFSLTKALQLVSIVEVNAISGSQTALAAITGVFFFNESLTTTLVLGVTMTVVGLALVDRGRKTPVGPATTDADSPPLPAVKSESPR